MNRGPRRADLKPAQGRERKRAARYAKMRLAALFPQAAALKSDALIALGLKRRMTHGRSLSFAALSLGCGLAVLIIGGERSACNGEICAGRGIPAQDRRAADD